MIFCAALWLWTIYFVIIGCEEWTLLFQVYLPYLHSINTPPSWLDCQVRPGQGYRESVTVEIYCGTFRRFDPDGKHLFLSAKLCMSPRTTDKTKVKYRSVVKLRTKDIAIHKRSLGTHFNFCLVWTMQTMLTLWTLKTGEGDGFKTKVERISIMAYWRFILQHQNDKSTRNAIDRANRTFPNSVENIWILRFAFKVWRGE